MPDPLPTPAPKRQDARNRAVRTFVEGLLAAVVTAIVAALPTLVSNPQWTGAYWLGVGMALATVALTAVGSYVARFLAPPSTT